VPVAASVRATAPQATSIPCLLALLAAADLPPPAPPTRGPAADRIHPCRWLGRHPRPIGTTSEPLLRSKPASKEKEPCGAGWSHVFWLCLAQSTPVSGNLGAPMLEPSPRTPFGRASHRAGAGVGFEALPNRA